MASLHARIVIKFNVLVMLRTLACLLSGGDCLYFEIVKFFCNTRNHPYITRRSGQLCSLSSKIKVLPFGTLFQTLDQEKFHHGTSSVASFANLIGPIPWSHSVPLCHALSLLLLLLSSSSSWTSHAACAIAIAGVRLATPGDWQCNGGSQ